jgi:CBS domain-containing protein
MDDPSVDAEDAFPITAEDLLAGDWPVDLQVLLPSEANVLSQRTRLEEVARCLKAGEPVSAVTVRGFLRWFWGSQRRGRWIVSHIREELERAGLRTVPDFESTYLDADISFELEIRSVDAKPAIRAEITESIEVAKQAVITTFADPTYRISKLAAANQKPVSVKPDSSLTEAVTLMMANDFSQLPVMVNDRDCKGHHQLGGYWNTACTGSITSLGTRRDGSPR